MMMPIGSWMIFIFLNCEGSRFWLGFPFLHHLTSVLSVSISSQWQHCLLIFFSIGANLLLVCTSRWRSSQIGVISLWQFIDGNSLAAIIPDQWYPYTALFLTVHQRRGKATIDSNDQQLTPKYKILRRSSVVFNRSRFWGRSVWKTCVCKKCK